ncbi:MAG: phosphodiester glycosidase family protein [Clostridia bacterium]|nr:phosphodiester glycosidase family protein [Clostridia bacterium]
MLKRLLTILICLLMLAGSALADSVKLPIDFSGGTRLRPKMFNGMESYEDPTISVVIETGFLDDFTQTQWWSATIKIGDASQLRTVAAESFDTNSVWPGKELAKEVNAVVAINGDYYNYFRGRGLVIRQAITYIDNLQGLRDILQIDEDGDFHLIRRANVGDAGKEINGKLVINSFFFGPALVIDGVATTDWKQNEWRDMARDARSARMALCQIGPLEYKVICCSAMNRKGKGMTLETFANFCQSQGAIQAYNLDGGDSTMLYFHGELVNDVPAERQRDLMDIVYFASAWNGKSKQE